MHQDHLCNRGPHPENAKLVGLPRDRLRFSFLSDGGKIKFWYDHMQLFTTHVKRVTIPVTVTALITLSVCDIDCI